jgi:ATP-binding cassette, subfamily C (CFTR/MRP), member 1
MSVDPRLVEKEWEANDPIVGANTTSQDEPISTEPGTPIEKEIEKDSSSEADEKKLDRNAIIPVMSRRSVVTSNNPESEIDAMQTKKSWNPLKRNPPPVPEERLPSAEFSAGWFSRLTFQWMNPLMTVRAAFPTI